MTGATPFVVTESSDLDDANTDGTVTVSPGETEILADYRLRNESLDRAHLLALGATDVANCSYTLEVDDSPRFSTRSPLGLVNDPYSFTNELGYAYPFEKYVTLKVTRDDDVAEDATMAGRMFVTEGGI